nr:hypothetical protein CFP56_56934 [Quercus suber]
MVTLDGSDPIAVIGKGYDKTNILTQKGWRATSDSFARANLALPIPTLVRSDAQTLKHTHEESSGPRLERRRALALIVRVSVMKSTDILAMADRYTKGFECQSSIHR